MQDNQLELINGSLTLTSMEVAEMVEKKHKNLLQDIRTYTKYLAELKVQPGEFFLENTYLDANNQERPCFEITEKGCEMIAHKMTGKKGTIFTAMYIDKFHEMKGIIEEAPKPKLSKKEELALEIFRGGADSIIAYKELSGIEIKEAVDKATKELKNGHNKILTTTEVVRMLNIDGLTTTVLFEWMANKGLGIYEKMNGEKKRTFQPNETFIKYVAIEGYSLTGSTINHKKIKVIFSTTFVDRLLDRHIAEIINFVRLKKVC